MSLLSVSNLNKSFGTDVIFSGVSFEVQAKDHIGLIGVNGCGKTTLFHILTGEAPADGGQVSKGKQTVTGYMEQHVCRDLQRSAYNEVLTVFEPLCKMERELEEIERTLQTKPDAMEALVEKQTDLTDRYVWEGGLTFRSRAKSALLGLGFSEEQAAMPVGVLSGGQRAKLQLAKMLLSGANLLLLDEPTNHLDLFSVEWLEDFLRSFGGAYIVISHDRYFLDRITTRTFELKNHRLKTYRGNYTSFLSQKEENDLSAQRKYDNTVKEIKRIEGIVEQQRRWNRERNIKTAESKLKAIGRLEQTLEKPESDEPPLHFHFGISQRGGNDVLTVQDLAMKFDGKQLFEKVNMEIHRRERVFLIGPNGCGKTSLLKTILNIYKPCGGSVRIGTGVEIGYYDQLQTSLNPNKSVIDEVWDYYPKMTETEIRNALAAFLFQSDEVFKPVSALSGGERARVLLLRLMLSRHNFLLLDEPSNHLDIRSCEALESALQNYEGTLLIVSHDRYLINKIADKVYFLETNGSTVYEGNYESYLEKSKKSPLPEAKPVVKQNNYKKRKELEAAIRKEKAEITRLENRIDETENKISDLQKQLTLPENAADYQAAMKLSEELEMTRKENEKLFSQWSRLMQKHESE